MPASRRSRSKVIEWLFAALNSVEMASLPWSIFKLAGENDGSQELRMLEAFLQARLKHMEVVLSECAWLVGSSSVADILMADVLRLVDRFDGLAKFPARRDYLERATARPSFGRAHQDQLAHFTAADSRV